MKTFKIIYVSVKIIFLSIFFNLTLNTYGEETRYLALVDSADMLMKKEKWDKAEIVIIEALREEPAVISNSLLFSNLGVVRTNLGNHEGAMEAFGLGLSMTPNSTVLLNNRSLALLKENKTEEALLDLDKSLDIDSIQEWPLQMRGLIYSASGETEKAKKDFQALFKNYPENDTAPAALGSIAENEGKEKEAAELYLKSLSIKETPEVWSSLILLKIKMNDYTGASENIRHCISLFPEQPEFYVWRGYLHRLNYRNEEALADEKIAVSKGADPELIKIYLHPGGR